MKFSLSITAICTALIAPSVMAQAAAGDAFPNKPVRIVVPFSAGGASDIMGRILAQKFTELWKSSVVVENKPGASGTLGGEFVRKAPADGHTLLLSDPSSLTALAAVNPQMIPYHPVNDFKPVAIAMSFPSVLAVNPDIGAKTLPELISMIRANPGKYTYSSSGTGTTSHLFAELFKSMANLDVLHVPYPGSGPGLNAVVAGHVTMSIDPINAVAPLAKGGRLLPLGVTGSTRSPEMPNVPIIGDAVPGFAVESWIALLVRPETPDALVRKIAADLRTAVLSPEIVKRYRDMGLTSVGSTPEQAQEIIKADLERWQRVVKSAGIKPQ